jgi:hypothetical protein
MLSREQACTIGTATHCLFFLIQTVRKWSLKNNNIWYETRTLINHSTKSFLSRLLSAPGS